MLVNAIAIASLLLPHDESFWLGKVSNLAGKVAVIVMLASLALWVCRQLYILIKKRNIRPFQGILRQFFLFFRKSHPLWGWIVLTTATIHAAYYFLPFTRLTPRMQTGIVAWIILACLVVFGLRYQSALRNRTLHKNIRLWHVITAVVFVIVALIHV
ncbi:hypothetical protein KDH_16270 [Dictyobacter sp. S3.2.2.5]|uniref:Ferric oxidoreductase domain-containing protein n=1 Tax=Dictyobacter halimunensis TaxID=3026934 RepID=A0ABQ6FQJ3_9CHLR|nr:hypothetical protein KDH_16270 [Dictyobacter sp. S3.2.2.5]